MTLNFFTILTIVSIFLATILSLFIFVKREVVINQFVIL